MTFGLTPTGFVAKTLEEIKGELEDAFRASLGADVDTSAESVLGQLIGVVAQKERELWELAEIVYHSRTAAGASFAALTELARLTGTARRAATKGTVQLSVTLSAGTTLPAGSVAAVTGAPTNRWVTTSAVNNPGPGVAVLLVYAEAETAGAVRANAGTITTIATPVSGWTVVTNLTDASPGEPEETDVELRARRELELSQPGTGTVPAIVADLLTLSKGVATFTNLTPAELAIVGGALLSVRVETNRSSWPDAEGRPPHSVEVVLLWLRGIDPGRKALAKAIVALQLYHSTPAGIDWVGTQTQVVTNENGQTETIRWNEATDVNVWVDVTLVTDGGYAGDGVVKAALVTWAEALLLGEDVIRSRLYPVLLAVAGVVDVIEVRLGRSASTIPANLSIDRREAALFDTGRITVTR